MDVTSSRALPVLLLAMSGPALAQYVGTTPSPQPGQPPATPSSALGQDFLIYPRNGQTPEQQSADLYQCHGWAKGQTGFDPTQVSGGVAPSEVGPRRAQYQRAMTACLEGRGYTVRYAAPVPAPPPPASAPSPYAVPAAGGATWWGGSELGYRPLTGQIEGGYTATAGATNDRFRGGSNIGLGLTWTPSATLPLGVRVDIDDNWLDAHRQWFPDGSGFTFGHAEVYGGNADLQLGLTPRSAPAQLYVFGGVGEYREWTDLKTVGLVTQPGCVPMYCGPITYPAVVAVDRSTSDWHLAWNAGLGAEFAIGDHLSWFIEARYLQIAISGNKLQLVPVRAGLRFF